MKARRQALGLGLGLAALAWPAVRLGQSPKTQAQGRRAAAARPEALAAGGGGAAQAAQVLPLTAAEVCLACALPASR